MAKPVVDAIHKAVLKEFKRRKISACELSRMSGVTVPQITRFMRGERSCGSQTLSMLFKALGLKVVRKK